MAPLLLALGLTHTHNPASKYKILNSKFVVKIHLIEVLLGLGKLRKSKSGRAIKNLKKSEKG